MSNEKRTRKVTVRFTPAEFEKLQKKFENAIASDLSYSIRNAVLDKPITFKFRNASLDSFIEELVAIRQELNAIGNNFNQVVKKLHVLKQIPEFKEWIITNEGLQRSLIAKTGQVYDKIEKISVQWWQG